MSAGLTDRQREAAALEAIGGSERHAIACPYCVFGSSIISVKRAPGGRVSFPTEPVQCDTCRNFFRLKAHVQITGAPIRGEGPRG